MTSDLRYPIGPIQDITEHNRAGLQAVATRMQQAALDWQTLLSELNAADLSRTYRPGSWTVHQLAHHTADAHLHGLNRLRYALTTDQYVIQPFDQAAWLTLPDAQLPTTEALNLLNTSNTRWIALLNEVEVTQFDRQITHPAEGQQNLWRLTAKHDWHLRHHLAHARIALRHNT